MTEEKKPPHLNVLTFSKEQPLEESFNYVVEYNDGTIEVVAAEGIQFFPGVNFAFFTKEDDDDMVLDYAINLSNVKSVKVKEE